MVSGQAEHKDAPNAGEVRRMIMGTQIAPEDDENEEKEDFD